MDIRQQHELEQSIAEATRFIPLTTLLLYSYFESLIKAGFTEDQALYLVAEHGTTCGVKGAHNE